MGIFKAHHKARLIAKGFSQVHGVDYSKTFTSIIKMTSVRLTQAITIANRWDVHQMDVKSSFVHGDIEEEIYMEQPPVLVILSIAGGIASQLPIPPKYDGFVYKKRISGDSILVEAFFDPVCPDSRDAWWPLKDVLRHYQHNITFIVHPFALPYHNNAFIASRSLHIANRINTSYTYPLLERFFKYQQRFYNKPTFQIAPATITKQIIHFALEKIGNSSFDKFISSFEDRTTDLVTRISFK
ncbi:hypothetical protein KI387_007872, partial [Taxus chinensis]